MSINDIKRAYAARESISGSELIKILDEIQRSLTDVENQAVKRSRSLIAVYDSTYGAAGSGDPQNPSKERQELIDEFLSKL